VCLVLRVCGVGEAIPLAKATTTPPLPVALSSMFSSRALTRAIHTTARRAAAAEGAQATATKVTLNLNTPYQSFFNNAQVDLVQIPSVDGEYGVTAGHTPIISQLKPGVIKVHVERERDIQSFFTAGGFALTHANSTTDIACVELVKLEDVDPVEAEAGLNKYKAAVAQFAEGTPEKAEAQIGFEIHSALVLALQGN
jgi:F-type H+-transporting ATPase subunit delta